MTDKDDQLVFPDGSRAELDEAMSRLLGTAQRVISTQSRLRSLLQASQDISAQTDLPAVLRTVVEVAIDLVGAHYGALGVVSPDGRLEQFINVGMPAELVAEIGHLPQGHGVLGALISDPHAIRLDDLGKHPRSSGFPAGHPEMKSFLGVPILVRGDVFGTIYVTQQQSGEFNEEDQELLTALASTAGTAIDNARLLDETRRRQRWSAASAEITAALVSDDANDSLGMIAERAVVLADADLVTVVVPISAEMLVIETARGTLADGIPGLVYPAIGSVAGRALESGQPVLTTESAGSASAASPLLDLGPTMAIPLRASGQSHGVLTVSRAPGRARFTPSDMDMAADFAGQASLALALARGRAARMHVTLLEERGRIARDLHDQVIQRLFATGIGLQSLETDIDDTAIRTRIDDTVMALDDCIAEIRMAIFALVSPRSRERTSIRRRMMDVVSDVSPLFATAPRVLFTGPLDVLVSDDMAEDILAVVREALTNVAKHAQASETLVSASVDGDFIVVTVTDDGVGFADSGRSSGVANMAARAARWAGDFSLNPRARGGTELRWRGAITESKEVAE